MEINEIVQGALKLNGDDKKYEITVENNKIITKAKWMNAVFFSPDAVTDEIREFKFTVSMNDNGTWTEIDESRHMTKKVGNGGFSMSYGGFKGKEISFSKTIGVGKNRDDGGVGVISVSFNTEELKKPIREYLESCGLKKAKKGFFATLFGK